LNENYYFEERKLIIEEVKKVVEGLVEFKVDD